MVDKKQRDGWWRTAAEGPSRSCVRATAAWPTKPRNGETDNTKTGTTLILGPAAAVVAAPSNGGRTEGCGRRAGFKIVNDVRSTEMVLLPLGTTAVDMVVGEGTARDCMGFEARDWRWQRLREEARASFWGTHEWWWSGCEWGSDAINSADDLRGGICCG